MIKCPKAFNDDDKWIALSLLSFLIKSDAEMKSLEIKYFKGEISEALGTDSSELEYFDELMGRPFNPDDFEKIDTPADKVIAKHILKEALRLSLADGDYSSDEKEILRKWADKNDLGVFFLEDLETYITQAVKADEIEEDLLKKLNETGEDLLNTETSSEETHNFFSKMRT